MTTPYSTPSVRSKCARPHSVFISSVGRSSPSPFVSRTRKYAFAGALAIEHDGPVGVVLADRCRHGEPCAELEEQLDVLSGFEVMQEVALDERVAGHVVVQHVFTAGRFDVLAEEVDLVLLEKALHGVPVVEALVADAVGEGRGDALPDDAHSGCGIAVWVAR